MKAKRSVMVLAGAVVLTSCGPPEQRSSSPPQDAAPSAVAVEVVLARPGRLLDGIIGSGLVRGAQEATVVAKVPGTIESVAIELGDAVAAGQVLLRSDAVIAELNLAEAREASESAAIELAAAERRFQAGNVSEIELRRARSALNGTRAVLKAAQATVTDHSPRAPFAGRIAMLGTDISTGNVLQPGVPIARVVDLSELRLDISVSERELRFVDVGAAARVRVAPCGDDGVIGQVESIAAGADERTGSFQVVVGWQNSCASARSGMSAEVVIEPNSATQLDIVIPKVAVRSQDGTRFVLIEDGGVARRRDIQLGRGLGDRTEVVDGLTDGERVIVSALPLLSDRSAVTATVVDYWSRQL